ncbi:MAG: hypothetical protein U0031_19850 [Thermomicrobiales bacterium]
MNSSELPDSGPRSSETERSTSEASRTGSEFDPTPYLRQLRGRGGGSEYLDVKWRLLWLRKEHPDARIITELVKFEPQMAIFKATVSLPSGGEATGYGSETAGDFADFIEKAETKAIGRALNALGYGAQFSERADDASEVSPPEAASPRPLSLPPRQAAPAPAAATMPAPAPASVAAPAKSPRPPESAAKATPAAEKDADLADYSWSAFWPWARERGLNGPREVEILIGQAVAGLSPAELRDLIIAADSQR